MVTFENDTNVHDEATESIDDAVPPATVRLVSLRKQGRRTAVDGTNSPASEITTMAIMV